jgi:hypothetical protein
MVPVAGFKPATYWISATRAFSVQKGVDFWGEESVTGAVPREGPVLAPRDPAPLAMESLRGFGGDGAECRYHQKDPPMSHSKSPSKTKIAGAKSVAKRSAKPERIPISRVRSLAAATYSRTILVAFGYAGWGRTSSSMRSKSTPGGLPRPTRPSSSTRTGTMSGKTPGNIPPSISERSLVMNQDLRRPLRPHATGRQL